MAAIPFYSNIIPKHLPMARGAKHPSMVPTASNCSSSGFSGFETSMQYEVHLLRSAALSVPLHLTAIHFGASPTTATPYCSRKLSYLQ